MDKNKNHTEELKKMITQSRSFDESEKKKLIEQLPNLKSEDMEKAIAVFSKEKEGWAELDKKAQENLNLFDEFIEKSAQEVTKMSQDIIHDAEEEESQKDTKEAEQLLKSL